MLHLKIYYLFINTFPETLSVKLHQKYRKKCALQSFAQISFADSMQQIHYFKGKLLPKEVQKFTSTIPIEDQTV